MNKNKEIIVLDHKRSNGKYTFITFATLIITMQS